MSCMTKQVGYSTGNKRPLGKVGLMLKYVMVQVG